MLVAACAGNKALSPLKLPQKLQASGAKEILRFLQSKYPGDRLDIFCVDAAGSDSCPSVQEYCDLKGLYGSVSRLDHAGTWISQLFETLNPHRFAHSLSVARTAVQLSSRYGENVVRAEEAGLLHDCAKCLSLPEMQKIARKHNLTDDPVFLDSSALLHSVVGSWIARRNYGMEDPEVLEAITYHNTGCAGMSRLSMCVCLADFIEPNRELFPSLEEVRRLSSVSLEKALLLSLESVADHVRTGGKILHSRTLGAIEWLKTLPAVRIAAESSVSVHQEENVTI